MECPISLCQREPVLVLDKNNHGFKLALPDVQRNSLSAIFRLPDDILADIFVRRARDYYRDRSGLLLHSTPDWVNVSYVCHRWRELALDCPTLWTFLFIVSRCWTKELLVRSKQAPLTVCVRHNPSEPEIMSFLEQAMEHADRIHEIQILPQYSTCPPFPSKFLSTSAPHLRSLEISSVYGPQGLTLPFQGDTPVLRTLKLSKCSVPWYSLKLTKLTVLVLDHLPVSLPMVDFLATLGRIPSLVHLELDHALPSPYDFLSSGAIDATPRINLSRLIRAWIVAPLLTVVAFLSCVNIPVETELRIGCKSESTFCPDDYGRFSSLCAQRFGTPNNPVLAGRAVRSLTIKHSFHLTTFTFYTLERECLSTSVLSMQHGQDIPLEIDFFRNSSSMTLDNIHCIDDLHRISRYLCSYMPLTSVQTIHFQHPPTSLDYLRMILEYLPNLRHIKMSAGYLMPDVASLLSISAQNFVGNEGDHSGRGQVRILVPCLEELELHGASLWTMPVSMPTCTGESHLQEAADLQSLHSALVTRKEFPCRLTMTRCHVLMSADDSGKLTTSLVGQWKDGHFRVTSNVDVRDLGIPELL